jgi:nucleotide sugar dehydrogenase
VCFAPERIDPANTAFEMDAVPRIIGGVSDGCVEAVAPVLEAISKRVHPVSSPEAAEMTKLLENTFRAVNISLANEVADVAHALDLDPVEIIDAAGTKPYGFMPFYPGPGVGGHCIPCDPHYLLWQLRDQRMYPAVISAAMEGIATRPARVVQRAAEVLELAGKPLRGADVLVVGVAYKPNVADTRESPALEVITGLQGRGAQVSVYDPVVEANELGDTQLPGTDDLLDVGKYDLVVVTCDHDQVPAEFFLDAALVLDATYHLPAASNRVVP